MNVGDISDLATTWNQELSNIHISITVLQLHVGVKKFPSTSHVIWWVCKRNMDTYIHRRLSHWVLFKSN